ncbi:DUF58 domain-containing protein [Aeromonas allosaccharophila]|uniref:DUF58 domain-containing protein n=1 Tax=Aeromonas TaxID=642 RepID=UPI001F2B3B57|nr:MULTISPECIES: DUF58 domain-containing protein [unclassified Aeromonas]MCE9951743.1 DUF58 domain-containing protein [Aeromonas allosaccharophila]
MPLDPGLHPDIALSLPRLLNIRLWANARARPRAGKSSSERGKPGRSPGLTFRELRAYQAGDEVRHIDWRVTARLGRPYTRLYSEELDQAHWLLLDLSPAMYFGSTLQLKARLGCELAAALIWQGMKQHNTLICHGLIPQHQSQRGSVLPLLESLCHHYQQGLARRALSHSLGATLSGLKLPHGAKLTIITDHRPCESALCQQLQLLSRRHDIHYWQIRDPLEAALPRGGQLPVAIDRPGQHYQGWLDGGHAGFSRRYRQAAEQQLAHSKQQLLPLVQRLYLLDNSQTLQQQWQEGLCHQG